MDRRGHTSHCLTNHLIIMSSAQSTTRTPPAEENPVPEDPVGYEYLVHLCQNGQRPLFRAILSTEEDDSDSEPPLADLLNNFVEQTRKNIRCLIQNGVYDKFCVHPSQRLFTILFGRDSEEVNMFIMCQVVERARAVLEAHDICVGEFKLEIKPMNGGFFISNNTSISMVWIQIYQGVVRIKTMSHTLLPLIQNLMVDADGSGDLSLKQVIETRDLSDPLSEDVNQVFVLPTHTPNGLPLMTMIIPAFPTNETINQCRDIVTNIFDAAVKANRPLRTLEQKVQVFEQMLNLYSAPSSTPSSEAHSQRPPQRASARRRRGGH